MPVKKVKRPLSPSIDDATYIASRPRNEHGEWRPVPGTDGLIVSSEGFIRRKPTCNWTMAYKPTPDNYGYLRFMHQGVGHAVHDCVARTFIGEPLLGQTVDHLNRNRGANRACNLRWATWSEQMINRGTQRPNSNGKPVFLRHVSWDSQCPSKWYETCYVAAEAIGSYHSSISRSARSGGVSRAGNFTAVWALSSETQSDLEGEEWRNVNKALRVSSEGRVQTKNTKNWTYKRTPVPCDSGYSRVSVNGKSQQVHVLIYNTFNGYQEGKTIDHINRNRSDNRLVNLRAATAQQQRSNQGPHKKRAKLYI